MSNKLKKEKKHKPKLEKKLVKLVNESDSSSESDHELSYYLNDRVKLMKQVIHILKPKKIKSMAPKCLKDLSIKEINSMLLEELLGISNKRLKKIFNGLPQDDDSSSTEEEDEKTPDVISLDDVTDDDFIIDLDSDTNDLNTTKKRVAKIKEEPKEKRTKVKKEKTKGKNEKRVLTNNDGIMDEASEEHLMSVLELLELQARARAIRSQLALENAKKAQEKKQEEEKEKTFNSSDVEDAIIIESPRNDEIVITSSDSETENSVLSSKKVNQEANTHKKNGNQIVIDIDDDINVSQKQLNSISSTSSNTSEANKKNDIENNSSSDPSSSKADLMEENPQDLNKLLNKFHKLKRQKRKLDEREMVKPDKRVKERKCKRKELKKSNKLNSCKQLDISAVASSESKVLETEKSIVENPVSTDSQKSIREDQHSVDDEDGIILNVDQVEIDSINSESKILSSPSKTSKSEARHMLNVTNELNETRRVISEENDKCNIVVNQICMENSDIKINNPEHYLKSINNETNLNSEEADGIILNIDQSELDSIN